MISMVAVEGLVVAAQMVIGERARVVTAHIQDALLFAESSACGRPIVSREDEVTQ